jgi:hypothetical protein
MQQIGGTSELDSTPVFGIQGNNVQLPCSLPHAYSNSVVEWVDYVYNDEHDPVTIFVWANSSGSIATSHPNARSFTVDENLTLKIFRVKFSDAGEYICRIKVDHVNLWHVSYYLNVACKF